MPVTNNDNQGSDQPLTSSFGTHEAGWIWSLPLDLEFAAGSGSRVERRNLQPQRQVSTPRRRCGGERSCRFRWVHEDNHILVRRKWSCRKQNSGGKIEAGGGGSGVVGERREKRTKGGDRERG
ncbi:hypothetical protein TIFTF001_018987 [Ficus carica]|uniref:Uncharacterized protein n=1 Tax=Ficus carica TaxID=3494 RepID=A0AA88AC54_FICCA|nr:hypothetical protein TIFTF001_018987 [Ficus carica]